MANTANETRLKDARQIVEALLDPITNQPFGALNAVEAVSFEDGHLIIALVLGYRADYLRESLAQTLWNNLSHLPGVERFSLDVSSNIPTLARPHEKGGLSEVKQIIAIASGKGGVGKSTCTMNLALALAAQGAQVGILDADIFGPSLPHMMGQPAARPKTSDKTFLPIMAHGVATMSMGYLVTEKTPMVWRGPMASGALQQILSQTQWGKLDYLFIDMPPGTGDIQLTLAQQVTLSGAVVITTPQNIALLDAQKGIEMFRKVSVPVLGVVENMSLHHCVACGHTEAIFGTGAGDTLASDYSVPLLGRLPLASKIREFADLGEPIVVKEPHSAEAKDYQAAALQIAGQAWLQAMDNAVSAPVVIETDD